MSIYCDHNASAPVRPQVLQRMLRVLSDAFGNASSVHAAGSRARCAVEEARAHVAALIGAVSAEVVFTSGGTESNNLAIFGGALQLGVTSVVTTPIEHASVREPIARLETNGAVVRRVPVDAWGRVSTIRREWEIEAPALVSVGWANNEVGTIQPIEQIALACKDAGHVLHVDAVQAAGKIPVRVTGIDLLSLSAHKLGGPQGIGALFVRRGISVRPLLLGGGQERGRRAGTENVAAIAGFGEACRLAASELGALLEASLVLRERLWAGLHSCVPRLHRNSPAVDCLPNTLNVSFEGVRGEALVAALDLEGIAVSSGSACAAGAGEPSHVLEAMGRSRDQARDGVRFSLGRGNTPADIDRVVAATAAAVERVRGVRAPRERT